MLSNASSENAVSPSLSTVQRHVIIVTGLSGAGKTSVVRALEDVGFYCVDNLPVPLIRTFLSFAFDANHNFPRVALGVDARDHAYLHTFISEVQTIQQNLPKDYQFTLIFLDASDVTINKRFQETRRRHPLEQRASLSDAIVHERNLLMPVMSIANFILDTDRLSIHELRGWVLRTFAADQPREMVVNLVSFGFKYGVPPESNLVYDLRFLPNPYFIPELRPLSGRDGAIADYIFKQEQAAICWQQLTTFLRYSLQRSYEECRFFVTVSLGCTGGRHRSVAFIERLAREQWENMRFLVYHRDVDRA